MRFLVILIGIILLSLAVTSSSAVLQELTYHGTLVSLDPVNNSIEINATAQFGCAFENGTTNCTWNPVTPVRLNGTAPDPAVFSVFKPGDHVEATSIGGAGGKWIGIGLIFPTPGIENWYATDVIGDSAVITAPLVGDYEVFYETFPDCMACIGTVCTAVTANVSITSTGTTVFEKVLKPGESFTYNGRNDNSSVKVTFVHGQASSDSCPNSTPMAGIQPISDFIIHASPPLAAPATSTTTTGPENGTPTPPTTKAPLASLTIAGALCLAGIALVLMSRR
jgi:hypothetical protein